jgi:hypothetical protein
MGGSGGTGLLPYFHPGAGLKPIVFELGPDLDILDDSSSGGWVDPGLGFECYFGRGHDGFEHCFPNRLSALVYTDSSCTRPAAHVEDPSPCGAPAPTHLSIMSGEACSTTTGYRVVGELPASTPLFLARGDSCEPLEPIDEPSLLLYEIEAMDLEHFVTLDRRKRPRHPALDAYVREGDESTWQVMGFFDPERQAPCKDLGLPLAPGLTCVPDYAVDRNTFGDAACETVVARGDACAIDPPTVIMEANAPFGCPPHASYSLYEIESTRAARTYQRDAAGACLPASEQAEEAYVRGAAIDLETLPALEHLELASYGGGTPGALRARFVGFDGFAFLPAGKGRESIIEAASGESCTPEMFADGVLRCVPSSFVRTSGNAVLHTTSTCDGTRLLYHAPGCPSALAPRGVALIDEDPVCLRHVTDSVAVLGVLMGPSELYRLDASTGRCEPVASAGFTSGTLFVLGETLDPDATFVALERVIRF